ncbi:MAG: tyrosine-type recombinase/integrase, partial [Firmicutes bacterium]|nr:tyrosine-type recombinase/integrase [Bacillota bacterium]
NLQVIHVPGTKTSNAERDVPIPLQLLPKIPRKGPFEYIFLSEQGHPLNPSISARWWRSFKNNMNIEMGCKVYRNKVMPPYAVAPDLTPYCFRHTFCTDLQAAGVPINVAKELMGHSDISLTARIYTHHSEEAFKNAANLINKFHEAK